MNNKEYWVKRAEQRVKEGQKMADEVANDIANAYLDGSRQIRKEVLKVVSRFADVGGLPINEAYKILKKVPDANILDMLKQAAKGAIEPEKQKELEALVSAPAYRYRLQQLESLQRQAESVMKKIAKLEEDKTSKHYIDLMDYQYKHQIFDIQQGLGIGFDFARLDEDEVKDIVNQKWLGQKFSERIWGRAANSNAKIKQELLVGVLTNRGFDRTADSITDIFKVDAWKSRRLVRTESAYMTSEAEKLAYKECGLDQYEYMSTLDARTSELCQGLDGKVFDVDKGVPGENMPPMHPWCRSVTVAVVEGADLEDLERRARDPITGENIKVPASMKYDEWESLMKEKHGDGDFEVKKRAAHNEAGDKEMFSRYRAALRELAPKTLEEFQRIRYNKGEAWEQLKYQYRTVNRYEIEGDVPIETVLKLDNAAWYTKQEAFPYKGVADKEKREGLKDLPKSGNAASMLLDGDIYFSHSSFGSDLSTELSVYTGKYPLVGLREDRKFKVKPISPTDGVPRQYDTEAKFLEFVADKKSPEDVFEVTLLSEKHICPSCQGVVEQFREMYPKAIVNIVSGKRGYNKSEDGLWTWKERFKAHKKRRKKGNA